MKIEGAPHPLPDPALLWSKYYSREKMDPEGPTEWTPLPTPTPVSGSGNRVGEGR